MWEFETSISIEPMTTEWLAFETDMVVINDGEIC